MYSPNQNIIKLYVNGVLENSMTPVAGATLNTLAETHVWLGVSGNNDPTLNGGINELRIYEGAFSDSDVAASHAAGSGDGLPVLARPSLAIESTRALGLTDLALSSTARWLRHPSQAERSAAVADTPYPLDVEPAGGILLPPREGPR